MRRVALSVLMVLALLANLGPSWGQARADRGLDSVVDLHGAHASVAAPRPMSASGAAPASPSDDPMAGRWAGIIVPLFRNSSPVDFTLTQDHDAVDGTMRGAFQYTVSGTFDATTMRFHASFSGVGRTGTLDGTLTTDGALLRGVFRARGFLFDEAGRWEAHKIRQ